MAEKEPAGPTGDAAHQPQLDAASLAAIIDGVAKKLQERPPGGLDPAAASGSGEHNGDPGKYLGRFPPMLHPKGVIFS